MVETDKPALSGRRAVLRVCMGGPAAAAIAATGWAAEAPKDATVNIDNFAFSPAKLMVARGTTVQWMNRDDIPHAIYCEKLSLRSHPMDTNDTFSHQFDQVGVFDYICSLHPHMHGQVVVQG